MKYFIESFASVANYITEINSRTVQDGMKEYSHTGSEDFTGTASYEAATDLALYGDRESMAKVQQSILRLRKDNAHTEQRAQSRVTRTVVGSRPCVPAAVMGHPCSMYRRHSVRVNKPVVTVYYAMTANGATSTITIMEVGAKVAEAVQIAERSGVRINLYAGDIAVQESAKQATAVFARIKDAAKDFDLLRMAYVLINPSYLRRHGFRWTETTPGLKANYWADGYGHVPSREVEQAIEKELKTRQAKCDVFLSFANIRSRSAQEIANIIVGGASL